MFLFSLLGEDPSGIPNNLVPYITQVAIGKLSKLSIFGMRLTDIWISKQYSYIYTTSFSYVAGADWTTKDGTGVRDYIHIVDLAQGHVAAIKKLLKDEEISMADNSEPQAGKVDVYNLGTGVGYSVLEVVEAMRKASGKEIKVEFAERRSGKELCKQRVEPQKR